MVKEMGLNRLNSFMTRWAFHLMLLKTAYTPDKIRQFVAQTKFRQYDIRTSAVGMDIWLAR